MSASYRNVLSMYSKLLQCQHGTLNVTMAIGTDQCRMTQQIDTSSDYIALDGNANNAWFTTVYGKWAVDVHAGVLHLKSNQRWCQPDNEPIMTT